MTVCLGHKGKGGSGCLGAAKGPSRSSCPAPCNPGQQSWLLLMGGCSPTAPSSVTNCAESLGSGLQWSALGFEVLTLLRACALALVYGYVGG